ncbi:hypothetical protein U1Q18_001168 [Sarracenia purpurea var. burkii]
MFAFQIEPDREIIEDDPSNAGSAKYLVRKEKIEETVMIGAGDHGITEAIRRLKIQTNDNQDSGVVDNSCPYPYRPGEPDCIYYLRTGLCGYGGKCKFNHPATAGQGGHYKGALPERAGQPDCGYYLKTGTCKYGSTCKYHHPRDRNGVGPVLLNILGLPMRQGEKPCPFYMKTGSCKFGAACKFDHPQPESVGTVLAVPGNAAYGSSGSQIVPPSGLHFVGGLPKAPYLSGSCLQGPQSYMPVVVSPSQGIAPANGWNTYLGCLNPISSTSVLGSNLGYNSKNYDESGSSGLLHMLSASIPHLPERPDQPECRHFMSNGSCKYGSDCKYHHPRERFAQLATNSLGPLGLPLRPGQAVCSYYSLYGLCKYGPTCKFDHPLTGYSYNYGLSYPTVFNPPFFPYQRNLPAILPLETSPPKPSKVPDWIRKAEVAKTDSNQNLNTEAPKNSSEQAHSLTNPLPALPKPHDESE